MKTAIEKIFYGKANCQKVPVTEEWKRLAEKETKLFEKFNASLTEEQKKQYNELYECLIEQAAEMELQYYREGVKLGLMLFAEAAID